MQFPLSHKGEHQVNKYGQKKARKGREPQTRSPEDPQCVLGTAGSSSWLGTGVDSHHLHQRIFWTQGRQGVVVVARAFGGWMGKGLSVFFPQFLKIALFDIEFLADGFVFQHFEYIISLP